MAEASTTEAEGPQEGRLLQIPGDDSPRSDVPTQVLTFAVAVALPEVVGDTDPAAFAGRALKDALSLHGLAVLGMVHHRDGSTLFPGGVPELPDPAAVTGTGSGTVSTGGSSAADAQADPEAETDTEVVEPADETGSDSGGPRSRSEPTSG